MPSRRKRSLRVARKVYLLLLLTCPVRADGDVAIDYESDDQLEYVQRLRSELSSEGYAVEIRRGAEPSPCDPDAAVVLQAAGTKTWIRVTAGPPESRTIRASICYVAAVPSLRQFSASAPRSDPRQLALATAEALNGLRSGLLTPTERPTNLNENVLADAERPSSERSRPERLVPIDRPMNSGVLGAGLVVALPDQPAAWGAVGRATLGVAPSLDITIDAFLPITGSELASREVTATLRTAWLRVGPRVGWALGDFHVSGAALAGPALAWATAVARTPRIGTAAISAAAVLSLAAFVEYPRTTTIFTCVSASASALLPGTRVRLGDDARAPRGSWLLEASIGLGARWGSGP